MTNKISLLQALKQFVNSSSDNSVVNSSLFSIILLFSLLFIGSFFQPIVYPLLDRVTYSTPFVEKYIINGDFDKIIILIATSLWFVFSIKNKQKLLFLGGYGSLITIALTFGISLVSDTIAIASFPLMLFLILLSKIGKIHFLSINKRAYTNAISILMIIIATISLFISLVSISYPDISLPSFNYFYYLYLIISLLSPLLLVIISLYALTMLTRIRSFIQIRNDVNPVKVEPIRQPGYLNLKVRLLILVFIVSLSSFIIAIPHLPSINPDSQVIGADTIDYVNYLKSIDNPTTINELYKTFVLLFEGDRSLSLITFYTISQILPNTTLVLAMDLLPFILAPLLIISIYFLTREITSNYSTSLLAAFITGVSFHTLIGVYGGLYANWYSLIFVNLAILFFVRSIRAGTIMNLCLFSALLVIVLFTHEPTWPILVLALLISLILIIFTHKRARKIALYLFVSMFPSFMFESVRITYTKNAGVIRDINYANDQGFGIHDFSTIWNNLITSTQTYLAGQFGNSIIYFLVVYWLFISDFKNKSNIVILVFLFLPMIPILFGDSVTMSRVLFEIPFQIPAAIALTYIMNHRSKTLAFVICLWLFAIGVRSSSNFYFDT